MISKKEVEHISQLARLRLSDSEFQGMRKDLSIILDYFDLLKDADISGVKFGFRDNPLSGMVPIKNIMREDVVKKVSVETINKLFGQAPIKEKGHIKVKGIL